MKNLFLLLLPALLLACVRDIQLTPPDDTDADRLQRPEIRNHTIYTAWGTKLRGSMTGTDAAYPQAPHIGPDEFDLMINSGFNAVHVYCEGPDSRPPGFTAAHCDYLVDEAERHGMYVVLAFGGVNGEAELHDSNAAYINAFWEFYAPRYADRKHVIYELCNEYGSDKGLDAMIEEVAGFYRTARRLAPETMILVWTFAGTDGAEWLMEWVAKTEALVPGGIPWTNEALAYHGYECRDDLTEIFGGATHHRDVIRAFTGAGYPLINTEVPGRHELTNYPDVTMYRTLEEEGIAWMSFVECNRIGLPTFWRGVFEAAGITWTPDYGDWPVTEADYPFGNHGGAISVVNNGRASLGRLNFGSRKPLYFVAAIKADRAGRIEIRSDDGSLAGEVEVKVSADYVETRVPMLNPPDGVRTVSLGYAAGEGLLEVKDWKFVLPDQEDYGNPYAGISAGSYPFHTGQIIRRTNSDAGVSAPFHAGGITDSSSLVFDYVWFDNKEVSLHIRARRLAGGRIKLYAGDFARIYPYAIELGICEIDGAQGEWAEYVCRLSINPLLWAGTIWSRWDLHLKFEGNSPAGSEELFEISKFIFK